MLSELAVPVENQITVGIKFQRIGGKMRGEV